MTTRTQRALCKTAFSVIGGFAALVLYVLFVALVGLIEMYFNVYPPLLSDLIGWDVGPIGFAIMVGISIVMVLFYAIRATLRLVRRRSWCE